MTTKKLCPKCEMCRFWSEMIASCDGAGFIMALCLSSKSPNRMKRTSGGMGCDEWKDAPYGAIDAPGNEGIYEATTK